MSYRHNFVVLFFIILFLYLFLTRTPNNIYATQTPCSAASELGLHCLRMSPKQVSGLKMDNGICKRIFFLYCINKK